VSISLHLSLPLSLSLSYTHTHPYLLFAPKCIFNAYSLDHKVSARTQLWVPTTLAELPFPPLFSQILFGSPIHNYSSVAEKAVRFFFSPTKNYFWELKQCSLINVQFNNYQTNTHVTPFMSRKSPACIPEAPSVPLPITTLSLIPQK